MTENPGLSQLPFRKLVPSPGNLGHFSFRLVPSILQPSAEAGTNLDSVTLAPELVAVEF